MPDQPAKKIPAKKAASAKAAEPAKAAHGFPRTGQPAPKAAMQKPKVTLPDHKDDLAAMAIRYGVPSYEAWAMTVDDLRDHLTKTLGA